nr:MAG TPA: Ubiquitin carboxyl-terminal hydrolase 20 [Caudoviricetes sp.]
MISVEMRTSDVWCFRCAVTLWAMLIADSEFCRIAQI